MNGWLVGILIAIIAGLLIYIFTKVGRSLGGTLPAPPSDPAPRLDDVDENLAKRKEEIDEMDMDSAVRRLNDVLRKLKRGGQGD